jgi:hypothetical protein
MDSETEMSSNLLQRLRASTESPSENMNYTGNNNGLGSPNRRSRRPKQRPAPPNTLKTTKNLEETTEALKNLLVKKHPEDKPQSSTPPIPIPKVKKDPFPSFTHSRSHSVQKPVIRSSKSSSPPSRRVFSASGAPPSDLSKPQLRESKSEDEDPAVKAEKELRKVLNLS